MDNNKYSSYEIYGDKPYEEYEQPNGNKKTNKTILLFIIIATVVVLAAIIVSASLIYGNHEYEDDGITYRYEDNTLYVSGDGDMSSLGDDDGHFLAKKLHVKVEDIEAVIIEEGITTIGEDSFFDYKNLVTLELPESLEIIDAGAFWGCESLEDFEFPENLEEIGSMAFYGCNSLTRAFVPTNVSKIASGAFANCGSITNAEISPSILGDSVFEGCPLLRVVAVYGDITSVCASSFKDCESLYAILLTEEITEIGENAFSGCDGMELVEFKGTKKQWESIDVADGNDILDKVNISFGDGTMIERIGNSTNADEKVDNDNDDAPSKSDTSKKTGSSKQLIAKPLSSKSGSGSAYAGLYKLSDGSFETSDGKLKTKLGKAMVLRDGTSMTAEAEYDADPSHDERLMVDNFYRNESLYFSVPYSDIMTGDIYLHDDLKSDEETKQSYNWDPEGFYAGLAFAAIHGDGWKYPLYKNSEYEDLTVRVMYYKKDVEAVFYIYAKFKSSPYEIEALCAADLSSVGNNTQSSGGNNVGEGDIDFSCNRCGGSGDCPTCGGSGYEYKRGSDGIQIKTGCGTCYGSGECPNPNCDNGRVKSN